MDDTSRSIAVKSLIRAGAWLVRCGADKVPMDGGWLEHPWTGEGVCDEVGNVPGRHSRLVLDVDVEGDLLLYEREISRMRKVSEIVKVFGPALFTVDTPSGGVHLYYAVHGHEPVGNMKTTFGDVRCDNGYAMLWGDGPQALLDSLLDTPITQDQVGIAREDFLEQIQPFLVAQAGDPSLPTPGGRRGRSEGDRNSGLFVRTRCAAERDSDPTRAIESALATALEAGLTPAEAAKAAAQGVKYGERKRTEERQALEEAFMAPTVGEEVPLPFTRADVVEENSPGARGGHAHTHPTDGRMLAEDMVARGGIAGRYLRLHEDQRWLVWVEGKGWREDPGGAQLLADIQRFGRDRFFAPVGRKRKIAQDKIAGGRLSLARDVAKVLPSIHPMGAFSKEMDAKPSYLALPGCKAVDLDTGQEVQAYPSDKLRRCTGARLWPFTGSTWERVVTHMLPEEAMRDALQALLGAALWGVPRTRAIVVLQGVTGAGKSIFERLIAAALGDYASTMKADTLTTKATAGIGFDVENANYRLRGVRLAVMSEIPRRRKLDPARINELTGGDDLVSRRAKGDQVATPASHSIVFACNDLPRIDVVDSPETAAALFQRLRLFSFKEAMPTELGAQAYAALGDERELGGVLFWLLQGAKRFRTVGERLPDTMRQALEAYWSALVWDEKE